jgi:hypothetical protein
MPTTYTFTEHGNPDTNGSVLKGFVNQVKSRGVPPCHRIPIQVLSAPPGVQTRAEHVASGCGREYP